MEVGSGTVFLQTSSKALLKLQTAARILVAADGLNKDSPNRKPLTGERDNTANHVFLTIKIPPWPPFLKRNRGEFSLVGGDKMLV